MNKFTWLLLVSLMVPACDRPGSNGDDISPDNGTEVPAVTTTQSGGVLARVNGVEVPMSRLHDALLEDFGLRPAQNIIADEVVRQALVRRNLPQEVSEMDIRSESVLALRRIFRFVKIPSGNQLDQMLNQFIASTSNFTRRAWDASMARNVRLGRLAENKIPKITEDEIRKAFFREYDGKIRVRTIRVASYSEAQAIVKRLEKGEQFAKLASKYSTHPSSRDGGLLPDIGTKSKPDIIPPVLARVAREDLKKPGDISDPVVCGAHIYILKLEEIIPPRKVKYDDVKEELRLFLREIKKFDLRQQILHSLIKKSRIEYVNPVIRAKYMELQRKVKAGPTDSKN